MKKGITLGIIIIIFTIILSVIIYYTQFHNNCRQDIECFENGLKECQTGLKFKIVQKPTGEEINPTSTIKHTVEEEIIGTKDDLCRVFRKETTIREGGIEKTELYVHYKSGDHSVGLDIERIH